MTETEWLAGNDPRRMIDSLSQRVERDARRLRLFAAGCCRVLWESMPRLAREWVELGEEVAEKGLPEEDFLPQRRAAVRKASASKDLFLTLATEPLAASPLVAAQNTEYDLRGTEHAPLLAVMLHEVFGNPYRPAALYPAWLRWNEGLVPKLARGLYEDRGFDRMPVLGDALEEAGCDNAEVLGHLHGPGPHVRGCWVLDLILAGG